MKKIICISILLFIIGINKLNAQENLYVGFWNVENLFDTVDDPEKTDEEFLPDAERNWDNGKLDRKQSKLARIIRSMNDGNGPDFLGLAEVENRTVIQQMLDKYLSEIKYNIVHYESEDQRGIDVALIYKSDVFSLVSSECLKVELEIKTRDILYAKLKFKNEILHVFINHWPSKREGEEVTEPKRIKAAETLRAKLNLILKSDPDANIILLGDFNDTPEHKSINKYLNAVKFDCNVLENLDATKLYNTSYKKFQEGDGSLMHSYKLELIDQIIISRALLDKQKLDYECDSFEIYKNPLMVTKTGKWAGSPRPTFSGPRYLDGYSDHFPVVAKFRILN